ncbi:MAG: WxcM-like domain-containing protein [Muribaculaceae bacterium]|nr:WxcM-like domain-containing protein [Muribaculaceae bacterium]
MDWNKPAIISLPRIYDPRGNLTFVQDGDQVPFHIARCYWTYDVPAGESRGGHSHHKAEELVIATGGSFNVNLFDGETWFTYTLNRPFEGLYIPPGYWRTLDNFSSGSVCMVLTSIPYSEEDYVRDYDEFKRLCKLNNMNK